MRFPLLAPALLILLLSIPPGSAACWTTSSPEIRSCNVGGTGAGESTVLGSCHYVDVDAPGDTAAFADVYVYRESNGIAGLQRGDAGRNDTCGGTIPADTVVL